MKLVIASGNEGKIREFRAILPSYGFEVVGIKELGVALDVEEDGATFMENAMKKARYVVEKTGFAALADDSGLCVDALGGAPGIYSARYAGEHGNDEKNNDKLLAALFNVPEQERTAHYAAAIALCYPDGHFVSGYGETEGRILRERTGTGGFGYDPLFFSDDLQKSFGLADADEKNCVSHRGRAIAELCQHLKEQ